MLQIAVITVSDRAFMGEYPDRSGPAIRTVLSDSLKDIEIRLALVPDDPGKINNALKDHLDCDWILTTGGSGIGPRDVTPEVCRRLCEKEIPGVAEWLRNESLKETPFAVFSRGFCGFMGGTIICNLPGSEKGAAFCARLLCRIIPHGTAMLRGEGH